LEVSDELNEYFSVIKWHSLNAPTNLGRTQLSVVNAYKMEIQMYSLRSFDLLLAR